ncbi:hypothetical protein Tco_1163809 [Tanacetum coccineum]
MMVKKWELNVGKGSGASGLVGESMKGGGNGREWEVAAASALIRNRGGELFFSVLRGWEDIASSLATSESDNCTDSSGLRRLSLPLSDGAVAGKDNNYRVAGAEYSHLRLLVNLNTISSSSSSIIAVNVHIHRPHRCPYHVHLPSSPPSAWIVR